MWNVVGNIAAVIAIVLLVQLLGLPGWLDRRFKRRRHAPDLSDKIAGLEERIARLERKSGGA